MTGLDWIVLIGTLGSIAVYGAWKTRGVHDMETYFRGGGTLRWPTIGLSIMATQASAITFLSTPWPGLRGRHALRAVLLRAAAGYDRHQRGLRAHLLPSRGHDRLRISRAPLRRPRPLSRRRPLPDPARARRRYHDLCAVDHPEHGTRLAAQCHQPRDGSARHRLHGVRRHAGGQPDAEAADDRHAGRHGAGSIAGRVAPAGRRLRARGAQARRRARPYERRQLRVRPRQPLHVLVGSGGRLLPGAVVLRHRPVAGTALPGWPFRHREPSRPAVQRPAEDSDAVRHSADRCAGVRLLPVHAAADVLRHRGAGARGADARGRCPAGIAGPLRPGVRRAAHCRDGIRRGARAQRGRRRVGGAGRPARRGGADRRAARGGKASGRDRAAGHRNQGCGLRVHRLRPALLSRAGWSAC